MPLPEECSAGQQAATVPVINFIVPSPMKVSGDRVTNWEFFRQQWEDYKLGTGLQHHPEPVHLATLRSVMGKTVLRYF